MTRRLRAMAWAAILVVASLTLAVVLQTSEPTEAAWADSEHATMSLWTEDAPADPDEDSDEADPEPPAEPDWADRVDAEAVAEVNEMRALQPDVSEGLRYELTSVRSVGGRSLNICHDYTLTNDSDQTREWELRFDTSQAPLWGWAPYDPATGDSQFQTQADPNLGAWTGEFDPETSVWTVRGEDFTGTDMGWLGDTRMLEPDQARSFRYCTENVPTPEVDPALFSWSVDVDASSPWEIGLSTRVTTDVETYIPWAVTVDLSEIICPEVLDDVNVRWDGDYGVPLDDSGHRFSYSYPEEAEEDLVRSDSDFARGIARINISNGRIGDHLQPNCS